MFVNQYIAESHAADLRAVAADGRRLRSASPGHHVTGRRLRLARGGRAGRLAAAFSVTGR
jgi:hypothetical protein